METESVLCSPSFASGKINTNRMALGERVAWITVIRYKELSSKACPGPLTWCLTEIVLACFYYKL